MRMCGDSSFKTWINASTVQNILLQIFGAIVNSLSLWCLWKCRRTGPAIKLQLGLVFLLLLIISVIILPGEGWMNYFSFFCQEEYLSDGATIFFLLSSGFFLQLERMNISSVAIYRFLAVQFPQLYKRLTQVRIVVILEIFMCAYISIPYVLGFTQTVQVVRFDDGNQYVKFGQSNTTIYKVIYKWYAYNFLIPFVITFVAYSLMVLTVSKVLYQKFKTNTLRKRDHVTFTLQFLILIDLVLDAPHAIAHFTKAKRVTMTIVHMVFHLHLLVDPLIFLFLNPHNRKTLMNLIRGILPESMAAYLPPPGTTSTNTHPKDSRGVSSPTPQQRRRFEVNRQESNSSLKLKHVFASTSPGEINFSKQSSENNKPLLTVSTNTPATQNIQESDGMASVPLTPVDEKSREF